jgi:hypothetical protein
MLTGIPANRIKNKTNLKRLSLRLLWRVSILVLVFISSMCEPAGCTVTHIPYRTYDCRLHSALLGLLQFCIRQRGDAECETVQELGIYKLVCVCVCHELLSLNAVKYWWGTKRFGCLSRCVSDSGGDCSCWSIPMKLSLSVKLEQLNWPHLLNVSSFKFTYPRAFIYMTFLSQRIWYKINEIMFGYERRCLARTE